MWKIARKQWPAEKTKDEAFSIALSRAFDMIGLSIIDVKTVQLSFDLLNQKMNKRKLMQRINVAGNPYCSYA